MPLSLPDFVRVVWVGRESLNLNRLRSHFTVRTSKVLKVESCYCVHVGQTFTRHRLQRILAWVAT